MRNFTSNLYQVKSWSIIIRRGIVMGCISALLVCASCVDATESPTKETPRSPENKAAQTPVPAKPLMDRPGASDSSAAELAYLVLPDQLDERAYYRLDSQSTCKANTSERTVIRSWANKVSFHAGRLLEWGMVCNDSPKAKPLREAAPELMVTRDLKTIRYKGETLVYSEQPPKLCDGGIWCPVKPEKQDHE